MEVYLLEGEDRWRAVVEPRLKRLRLELEAERGSGLASFAACAMSARAAGDGWGARKLLSTPRPSGRSQRRAKAIHAATDAAQAIIVIDRSIAEALAARAAQKPA